MCSEKLHKIHRKTPVPESQKESLALVFSCEVYEISENNFSQRTPLVAAQAFSEDSTIGALLKTDS